MKTDVVKIIGDISSVENTAVIEKASQIIKNGGLVAFPTETVYGLGADATNADSAKKIYAAKGRPSDNPLIIHISRAEDAEKYAYTNALYYKLTDAFSPGPLTVILPKKSIVPDSVTGGMDTVAIRIPSHPVARALIEKCDVAIAAPSANTSGKPSPTSAQHVIEDLMGRTDMIIDGGDCDIGLESTVVRISDNRIDLLRPGAVDCEMLKSVCDNVKISQAVLEKLQDGEKAESPGMRYKHYAPDMPVYLVRGEESDVNAFFVKQLANDPTVGILCYKDAEVSGINVKYLEKSHTKQANVLFGYLRDFNKSNARAVYSVIPDTDGIGLAVLNRLIRAAGFNVIDARPFKIIGLTGQSGAGKGEACKIFAEYGIPCIDTDKVYRQLLETNTEMLGEIRQRFGEGVFENSALNRKALAKVVFGTNASGALEDLNKITHKYILNKSQDIAQAYKNEGYTCVVIDAPQLFESGFDKNCDATVAVVADESTIVQRVMKRDNISEEDALARIKNQHTKEYFQTHCTYVIENNKDIGCLKTQVAQYVSTFKGE